MTIEFKSHFPKFIERENTSALYDQFIQITDSPDIGYLKLPYNLQLIDSCKDIYKKHKGVKSFYHFGIGGSALGPKMMVHALKKNDLIFHFVDNIDSDTISNLFEKIDFSDSLFYFVSKSGSTAETLALLTVLLNKMESKGIGSDKYKDSIVVCTENKKSDLKDFADKYHIDTLEIPLNIGGRFSALTPVAYFPCLFADIDVKKISFGAQVIAKKMANKQSAEEFLIMAQNIFLLIEKGVNQTVLMAYSDKLKYFAQWFVQLWAESLGKNNKGLTPICAIGATDQHSQLQLFSEGEANKAYFFIELLKRSSDFKLDNKQEYSAFKKLAPHTLNQLLKAEFEGTIKSLIEKELPIVHVKVSELNEENLGKLILTYEVLTQLVGQLLQINPFDQPGVETS